MWSTPKGHGDAKVLQVQNWLEAHYTEPVLIDELAQRFGFGTRNFKRRFKEATGYSPLAYLQTLRLEQAKHLLETTRLSLERITFQAGTRTAIHFAGCSSSASACRRRPTARPSRYAACRPDGLSPRCCG